MKITMFFLITPKLKTYVIICVIKSIKQNVTSNCIIYLLLFINYHLFIIYYYYCYLLFIYYWEYK